MKNNEEDLTILLLLSLLKSCDDLITTLLIGKKMINIEDINVVLLNS
jgi:Mg2+/Co2+ transporter CorB